VLHEDRARATSFGAQADLYHRTRPAYPAALVDELTRDGPVDVLDVGCGTGISAELFRQRGCRVLGVEVDDRMADYARSLGLAVETASFEEWAAAGRAFDLVISGQAWHWVDPDRGAAKAAEVLRPGGRIGLFWNRACHPPEVSDAFSAVYHRFAPGLESYSIVLGQGTGDRFDVATVGLAGAGEFEPARRLSFRWQAVYTTRKWLDHLLTHSDHQALAEETRQALLAGVAGAIDSLGGSFRTEYEAVLITARRR